MEAQRIQVKLYASSRPAPIDAIGPVFHDLIRRQALDELLIDVVDYRHVHHGPGVVLIGHAADYALDLGEGRPGLVYTRKRMAPPPAERLRDALVRALRACLLLEREPALDGQLAFVTDEVLLRFPDRLRAPPGEPGSVAAVESELGELLGAVFGAVRLDRVGSTLDPVSFRARASLPAPSLEALLERARPSAGC